MIETRQNEANLINCEHNKELIEEEFFEDLKKCFDGDCER